MPFTRDPSISSFIEPEVLIFSMDDDYVAPKSRLLVRSRKPMTFISQHFLPIPNLTTLEAVKQKLNRTP